MKTILFVLTVTVMVVAGCASDHSNDYNHNHPNYNGANSPGNPGDNVPPPGSPHNDTGRPNGETPNNP